MIWRIILVIAVTVLLCTAWWPYFAIPRQVERYSCFTREGEVATELPCHIVTGLGGT